jgi:hypothetical protein
MNNSKNIHKTCVANKMKIQSFIELRKITAVSHTAVVLIVNAVVDAAVSGGFW